MRRTFSLCLAAAIAATMLLPQDSLAARVTRLTQPTVARSATKVAPPTPVAQEDENTPATEIERDPQDIWQRIRSGFQLPELNNARAAELLNFYASRPKLVENAAERSSLYLYHIIEEVQARGLPSELALLPFVESAFHPEALSYAKAAGLWQFMPATGRHFSLKQNMWIDERRDVMESTRAALDYLQRLYAMFGDWQLALAAYNWGEGNVQRAIKANQARGLPGDYAHLKMPLETARYVPKLQAIKTIIADPERFGVSLPEVSNEPFFVRVSKTRDIDVQTAAELADLPEDIFRRLNPGFNLPVIVASHDASFLLPRNRLDVFIDNLVAKIAQDEPLSNWMMYTLAPGETLENVANRTGMTLEQLRKVNRIPTNRKVLAGSSLLVPSGDNLAPAIAADAASASVKFSTPAPSLSPETTRVIYHVRRGDTLHRIALNHGTTPEAIRKTNHLQRGTGIRIGQRLVIAVESNKFKRTFTKNRKIRLTLKRSGEKPVYYTVKPKDTLFSISQRTRVPLEQLRALNQLHSKRISVNQKLRIK